MCLLAHQSVYPANSYSVSHSVCPSVSQSVSQSVCQSVHQSVSRLAHQLVSWSVRHSVSPSVRQSIRQSIHQSISPSVHQSVSVSVHLFISPSVCQSAPQGLNYKNLPVFMVVSGREVLGKFCQLQVQVSCHLFLFYSYVLHMNCFSIKFVMFILDSHTVLLISFLRFCW